MIHRRLLTGSNQQLRLFLVRPLLLEFLKAVSAFFNLCACSILVASEITPKTPIDPVAKIIAHLFTNCSGLTVN
jgi:hypothetical protein